MYEKLKKLLGDTPETYYWVGFIMADGHFSENRLKIGLSSKDSEHLYKLWEYLGCHNVFYKDNTKCEFSIMDSKTVPLIKKKFDINQRKSYEPPKTINWIPSHLKYAFIIGFIDGDGSIVKQSGRDDALLRIKLHSSWLGILLEISQFISEDSNVKLVKPTINKQGYANLNLANNVVLKKLKNYTIEYNLPVLERKWVMIDENHTNKNEISKWRVEQVSEMMKMGMSNKEIREKLNLKKSTLSLLQKRNGLR